MLLEILQRQDHELLPKFCEMLDKSHQRHIARLIRENVRKQEQQQQQQPGKHTSVSSSAYIPLFQIIGWNKNQHSLTIITLPLRAVRIFCSY